jgi:hypothetical protein
MALTENINLVETQYLQMLHDTWNDKMAGHFKAAILGIHYLCQ